MREQRQGRYHSWHRDPRGCLVLMGCMLSDNLLHCSNSPFLGWIAPKKHPEERLKVLEFVLS